MTTFITTWYSHLLIAVEVGINMELVQKLQINKSGGWNNRGGWNFFEKSINVEGGFLRGGWIFFSKNHLNLYFQTKKGSNFLNQLQIS